LHYQGPALILRVKTDKSFKINMFTKVTQILITWHYKCYRLHIIHSNFLLMEYCFLINMQPVSARHFDIIIRYLISLSLEKLNLNESETYNNLHLIEFETWEQWVNNTHTCTLYIANACTCKLLKWFRTFCGLQVRFDSCLKLICWSVCYCIRKWLFSLLKSGFAYHIKHLCV